MAPDFDRNIVSATLTGIFSVGLLYVISPVPAPVATAIFGVLVLLAAWQPVVILGLIAATLPLYHQPFQAGSAELAPSELLLVSIVLGSAIRATRPVRVAAIREYVASRIRRLLQPVGIASIAALIVLAAVAAGLLALVDEPVARSAGLREMRWTIIEPAIFLTLLLWHVERRAEEAIVLGAFVAGGIAVALWGLADALTGGGVSVGGITRASGPFPHPNAYAIYLLRPIVFGVAFLIVSRSRSPMLWAICALGGVALAASFSRSAALGLIVAGALLWPWISVRLRVVSGVAAAVASVALLGIARERAIGESGTDSLALRTDIWKSGLSMIRDRPILGYGPDQFLYTYSPRYIDPAGWAERFTAHGHNFLIDAWLRVGIIGAVFAVIALAIIARASLATVAAAKQDRTDALRISALIALAAAGTQAMVDNGYFVHDLAMSAWLLVWIAFARLAMHARRGTRLHGRYRNRRSGTRRLAPL